MDPVPADVLEGKPMAPTEPAGPAAVEIPAAEVRIAFPLSRLFGER